MSCENKNERNAFSGGGCMVNKAVYELDMKAH